MKIHHCRLFITMLAACGVQALAQSAPEITEPAEEVTVAASRMLAPE